MLLLETSGGALTVLPAHRVARGIADGAGLLAAAGSLFDLEPADAATLERAFGPGASAPGGAGRFGLWTRQGGAIMTARRAAIAPFLAPGGEALRRLDVTILATALEQAERDRPGGDRHRGPHRIHEVRGRGDRVGVDEPSTAQTPRSCWSDAGRGDRGRGGGRRRDAPEAHRLYPKPLTGFVINPLEW